MKFLLTGSIVVLLVLVTGAALTPGSPPIAQASAVGKPRLSGAFASGSQYKTPSGLLNSPQGFAAEPDRLRSGGPSPTPPLPPTTVCFWSDGGPACVERAGISLQGMGQGDEAALGAALLRALLTGPTPQEQARGLRSAIPHGTALDGLDFSPDRTVTVRLIVPSEELRSLTHGRFEAIVEQIAGTLQPLNWGNLRIQTRDPATGQFVPLASFLPDLPAPRKESVSTETGLGLVSQAVGGLAEAGSAPEGALKGKTVYISAGHGWLWTGSAWKTQRAPYPTDPYVGPIIEDHNNAEAVNQYLIQYLQNAGARVIPVRERDMNAAAIVVDNDSPQPGAYTETGHWTTSGLPGYRNTTYRYATTVTGTATATATWAIPVPADGEYAVYVWYRQGTNRAPDARYTVHHAGGQTEVIVDQRIHGNTWHYLGTYGFRGGTVATVTLSNRSAYAGLAVIADAVRLGGGVFSSLTEVYTTTASYPPNKPWWEVGAFYTVQRMGLNPQALGLDPDDPQDNWGDFNDVVARPMYARWEHAGTGEDAVYISWHTNGFNGYQTAASGTETYIHNGEDLPTTPGSLELATAVHTELIRDLRAGWDPAWPDRGVKRKNLGELRLLWDPDPAVRMPGALIELAFHDNPTDTDALKEPTFNMLAARAIYQGIVKYFETRDGVDLPLLPEPPTHLAVRNAGDGRVQVSWRPSPTDTLGLRGDPATGYRVYTSTDGIGWSSGIPVTGTTVYTLTGLSPGQLLFVRVTATNAGGESFPTETLAVRVGDGAGVLIVNGFDRLNRTMLVPETDPVMGYNLRMFLNRMNRHDYAVQHGAAIPYPFDSASNEAVRDGMVRLNDYVIVDWILGEESAPDETLDGTERLLLRAFLENGGALFISGTEVGWHLDFLGADRDFYRQVLRAQYAADDAGTYVVTPTVSSIFAGLAPFRFDAPGMYDPDYPDVITPTGGSAAALAYVGGTGGTAAVQYASGCQRLVYFAFPFETVDPNARPTVMSRVLDFLDDCLPPQAVNTIITTPPDGGAYNTPPPFAGTVEVQETSTFVRAAALTQVGVQQVEVQVERDGTYWNGSAWETTPLWVTTPYTDIWSYDLNPVLDQDGDYILRARAWAVGNISDTTPAQVAVTYDTISPTATSLMTPTGGVSLTAVAVRLEWQPVTDTGSPIAYVVRLDEDVFTTTQPVYTVPVISEGSHTWGVQVVDAAGNRSEWVTETFSIRQHHAWLPLVMRNYQPPSPSGLVNGGFETDEGWVLNRLAIYVNEPVHSGSRSVRLGIPPGEPGQYAYSSVSQAFVVPAGPTATLSLWVYLRSEGDRDDLYYISLYDGSGEYRLLDTWRPGDLPEGTWVERQVDLSPYAGQRVTLYIGVKNDGDEQTAAVYVDDVRLQ